MRVPIVLFALATAPFLSAAGQGAAVKDAGQCDVADANRSPTSWSRVRPGDPWGRVRIGCAPVAPQPQDPPPPPQPPSGGGSASITGSIYNDISGTPGLGGWVVELTGALTATAVTDGAGNYQFLGLPGGTYTVCEVVPSGWLQTWPPGGTSCSTGYGYTFDLLNGQGGSYVDFFNVIH